MRLPIDRRFFDQPGFTTLYEAWSNVFEQNADGTYVLAPAQAIAHVEDARQRVFIEDPIDRDSTLTLESIACRYAQELPIQGEEVSRGHI